MTRSGLDPETAERDSASSGRWIGVVVVIAVVLSVIAWQRPTSPFAPTSADLPSASPAPVAGIAVTMGTGSCGSGWTGGTAGPTTLALTNSFGEVGDAYLEGSDGKLYLAVEALGPGASRTATVSLPDGTYRLVCGYTEGGTYAGPDVTVSGSYAGATTPGVLPVTDNDLYGPLKSYTSWVQGRIPVVQRQVARLQQDLSRGRTAQAKKAWLTAHMTYCTLGAAYGAFGSLGEAIDGMPSTQVGALTDSGLHGFHKVEALLWAGRKDSTIVPTVKKLAAALKTLHQQFGTQMYMTTTDIGLRAHEILEDALRFEVTGMTDAGSHTALATVSANIVGTQHALTPLTSVLKPRDPDYAVMSSWLTRLATLVDSFHHGASDNAGWTPLSRLTQMQRERLDATLSQTLEYLSQVAAITDPVRAMP